MGGSSGHSEHEGYTEHAEHSEHEDIAALEQLTRTLVGVVLDSLEALDGRLTVPQFRLLLTLDSLGKTTSSQVAGTLGMSAPSITRLADQLAAKGLIVRGGDRTNRSIVTLGTTPAARELVAAVLARRQAQLATMLNHLDPADRADLTRIVRGMTGTGRPGPVTGSSPLPL